MVLIGLVQNCFFENLKTKKFPSLVINVRKQDLMKIRQIDFLYKLIEVNLTASKELSNLEILREHILFILGTIKKRIVYKINENSLYDCPIILK